ncbi:MAG: hypothetical protein KF729_14090 [Sandaracinaceae bacterium]|nr:hypothetical protein [Sandaracinaceae bacterium]
MRRSLLLALALVGSGASAQEAPLPFVGGELDQDEILERMSPHFVRELRQVGTSSVTLRADLAAVRVAFKPRTDLHPRGYLAEIAAYRIARALGMDNVPPVRGLRLGRAMMRERFRSDHAEDWPPIEAAIRWDEGATVRGAAIYWIPAMRPSELATEAGLDASTPWLRLEGEVPEGAQGVARDLSTMLAFDYLIANWDRLSGGNVSTTAQGDRLFVRDHNVAFGQLVPARYERLRQTLERTQRFSRGFVARLAALDATALRASLAADGEALGGRAVLDDAQIAAFSARRRALLSYVAALVAVHGAERVLVWE